MYLKMISHLTAREIANASGNLAFDASELAFSTDNNALLNQAQELELFSETLSDAIATEYSSGVKSDVIPHLVSDVIRVYEKTLNMFEA